ncbi:hypothetical protein MW290_18170 [Aquincola tertiaricarbonis]|uniref:Glutelin n=1 Tax=Aquincola tertiaricarbonis TaxID=391953 RepID=A0ABY4SFL6_AQUTE|nr:hypothetical protein [Aquincola tertiaricarbonis]URI10907.1 hypothetical protein MW290_18170 [Aquincola tertiaricarbonis]
MSLRKTLSAVTLLSAGVLAAGAAQARDVYWSVGINAPVAGVGVGTVISNAPPARYYSPPPARYYAPPAVVYQPAPVVAVPAYPVYQPAPVLYAPPVRYYRPAPPPPAYVVVPQRAPRHWHGGRWADRDGDGRWDGWRHGR